MMIEELTSGIRHRVARPECDLHDDRWFCWPCCACVALGATCYCGDTVGRPSPRKRYENITVLERASILLLGFKAGVATRYFTLTEGAERLGILAAWWASSVQQLPSAATEQELLRSKLKADAALEINADEDDLVAWRGVLQLLAVDGLGGLSEEGRAELCAWLSSLIPEDPSIEPLLEALAE